MPAGAVEDENGVGIGVDRGGDLSAASLVKLVGLQQLHRNLSSLDPDVDEPPPDFGPVLAGLFGSLTQA